MNEALATSKLPPMLTQYLEFKRQLPDCILFFQVGDFYELFFEDAVTTARSLNLTLTSRDKNSPEPVPMCGVPLSVVDGYVDRLVGLGFSAALVSQREETQGGKQAIIRKLDRIVTPGIRLLSHCDNQLAGSMVASVYWNSEKDISLALSNVQSGRIHMRENLDVSRLKSELARFAPNEIVFPRAANGESIDRRSSLVREVEASVRSAVVKFRSESGSTRTRALSSIPGYSSLSSSGKMAARLLIAYIDETTVESTLEISEISVGGHDGGLIIDAVTQANLELVRNARDGSARGTLFEYMDRTVTPGGSRLLRQWILQPLVDIGGIERRHESVRRSKDSPAERTASRAGMEGSADLERIAARIELDVATPRELSALRSLLATLPDLRASVDRMLETAKAQRLSEIASSLHSPDGALPLLESALADNPPLVTNEGGIIRDGFDPEVDRLREIRSQGHSWMEELETEERRRTGIGSLRVRYNSVLGYFIEVTRANAHKVPEHYLRRQSTANTERFTIPELSSRQSEVLSAMDRLIARERTLFEKIRNDLRSACGSFRDLAAGLAELDVLLALGDLADREGLVEPRMENTTSLAISDGRHPALSKMLGPDFIPNSLELESERFVILTGPNMGGKSTFLRQVALIVIMAQSGSFVPAAEARIGITDRIFARIGASDDLHEGDSTFMVEMKEASHILAHASERSLIVIDEIGRGTTTTDGLAIARSILEWILTEISSRTLFATHFHELTDLERHHPEIRNLSVGSVDRGGDVIFTHRIERGPANKSYGLEVAKLAGLPERLLARAREILADLEAEKSRAKPSRSQLSLFDGKSRRAPAPAIPSDYAALRKLGDEIRGSDLDRMTPLQALNLLQALKTTLA